MFLCFSESSREPLNPYGAMGQWGYRGVSGFYDPAIRPLPFNRDGRRKNRIAPSRKEGALTPRCSYVLSRGNQRADFESPRSLAILMKPYDQHV